MAKLKFAFQAEYYKTHPRQLRDYVFGYFHITAGVASSIAPLSNAILEIPVFKNLVARMLGITPHRPFPKFKNHVTLSQATLAPGASAGESLPPRNGILRRSAAQNDKMRVIFLSDPFARYIEPETEQAALDILSRCDFDVHILPVLGAGASLLSKGFIDAAKRHAGTVLDALDQIDPAREAPIVGLEPPEIYSLKHDYVDLLPEREEEITRRTSRVWLLDEFLLRADEFDALRVAMLGQSPTPKDNFSKKIKFHPHCHQRAEGLAADGLPVGTNATVELLRACGFDVELLDTGCCGMAGTFGYEAEHYELSMKVGELKLFPALAPSAPTPSERGTSPKSGMESSQVNQSSTVGFGGLRSVPEGQREGVISTGAACRMQIRQGTGINALHPVILIADFIKGHTNQKDLQGPHHPAQRRARGV
jgi:Fe-S oxidoreductase